MFVDFSGHRLPIYDAATGEESFRAELFVSVLGGVELPFMPRRSPPRSSATG